MSLAIIISYLCGCSFLPVVGKKASPVKESVYSGPKAKISIADFEIISSKISSQAGIGLRLMLIEKLTGTGRFTVEDRADLLLRVTVSVFEPNASGGRLGIGGGGGLNNGLIGGLINNVNKSHMVLDISIIDTADSGTIFSSKVLAQASEVDEYAAENKILAQDLAIYENTPMEKTINICLQEALRYVKEAVPLKYYKY